MIKSCLEESKPENSEVTNSDVVESTEVVQTSGDIFVFEFSL